MRCCPPVSWSQEPWAVITWLYALRGDYLAAPVLLYCITCLFYCTVLLACITVLCYLPVLLYCITWLYYLPVSL